MKSSTCPALETLALLGKSWNMIILRNLCQTGMGFAELERALARISSRTLSARLSELTAAGLVERIVDVGPPIRIRYRLTDRATGLHAILGQIEAWARGGETVAA